MGVFMLAVALAAAAVPADLETAVKAYDSAQVKGDRAALERLLADDYLLANSAGKIQTKAEFIADLTAPDYRMEPFTVERPIERVWANGAVTGGVAWARGTSGGQPFAVRLRFADVWAKRNGRWQVIFSQAARAVEGE